MKKISLLLIIIIIILSNFTSCKKGENDPALSLRSRKARLVGDWKLKEGHQVITISSGGVETYTYNGSVQIHEKTGDPTKTTAFTEEFDLRKDGSCTWTTLDDTDLHIVEGKWYFGEKNKDLNIKCKETFGILTEKYTSASGGGTPYIVEMTGTQVVAYPKIWQIDRLANDELVILTDYTYTTSTGVATAKGTMTYTQE